jgi:hypothetical protein
MNLQGFEWKHDIYIDNWHAIVLQACLQKKPNVILYMVWETNINWLMLSYLGSFVF